MSNRGWVGFDLDGTVAHYDHWRGEDHIGEPIKPMIDRIKAYLDSGVSVKIFTARVCEDQDGRIASIIQDWTEKHVGDRLPVTNKKDYAMIRLYDDRAVQVRMNTGEVVL